MEQLESRALGKPKETVEHQDGKSEVDEALDRMSTEDLEALVQQGRHLRDRRSCLRLRAWRVLDPEHHATAIVIRPPQGLV